MIRWRGLCGSHFLIFSLHWVHLNLLKMRIFRVFFMHVRNLFLAFLCLFFSSPSAASSASSTTDSGFWTGMAAMGAIRGISDLVIPLGTKIEGKGYQIASIVLITLFALSLAQKENKEFFSTCARYVEWPFMWTSKKLQKVFTGGRSLTYNEVASWHNRVARLLTPLTKTTAMVDLSKDRRLKIMDQDDGKDDGIDDQWARQAAHIEKEFNFLIKVLTVRLAFYKDPKLTKKQKGWLIKAPHRVVSPMGKSFVRMSLIRHDEVAFQLEEAISYLKEVIDYCKSVSHFSAIDKEHMKRLMGSTCTTFEHIGVLIDELSVADRTKNKIPMTIDGALNRGGYSSGSYGSYGSEYGSGGSYA